jgi:hypothetical protein
VKTTLNDIKFELYKALTLADVGSGLLAIVGSWIDTASVNIFPRLKPWDFRRA